MQSDNLYNLIIKYESLIVRGNNMLQKYYNVTLPPILAKTKGFIPKTGTIELDGEKLSFNFHGIGCLFEFGNVKVDFDYIFKDFIYKGFDPFKLHLFILSFTLPDEPLRDISKFNAAIESLCYRNLIMKKDKDLGDTYKYSRTI